MRMMELKNFANDWNCSTVEAAYECVCMFYEAAGFDGECLTNELSTKTSAEILTMYQQL